MSDLLQDVELDDGLKQQLAERFDAMLQERMEAETKGLKSKVDELLGEKKRVQREKEEAALMAAQEAEERAAKANDYKQLYESQKQQADSLRSTIEKMNGDIQRQRISQEAAKIASTLTKDTVRAELLQEKLSQRMTLVDGEIRVTDESGQLTVSSLDDLTNAVKSRYAVLIDGSQASGGGAVRAQGGAEARGGKEMSRAEFNGLTMRQQSEFMRGGGKLFDE